MKLLIKDPVTGRTSAIEAVPGIPSGGDIDTEGHIAAIQHVPVDYTTVAPTPGQIAGFATVGGETKQIPVTLSSSGLSWKSLLLVDFRTLPTQNLGTDGTYTIGGVAGWTKCSSAQDRLPMTINPSGDASGEGLKIAPNDGSQWWSTRNIPALVLNLGTLMTAAGVSAATPLRIIYGMKSISGDSPTAYVVHVGLVVGSYASVEHSWTTGEDLHNMNGHVPCQRVRFVHYGGVYLDQNWSYANSLGKAGIGGWALEFPFGVSRRHYNIYNGYPSTDWNYTSVPAVDVPHPFSDLAMVGYGYLNFSNQPNRWQSVNDDWSLFNPARST